MLQGMAGARQDVRLPRVQGSPLPVPGVEDNGIEDDLAEPEERWQLTEPERCQVLLLRIPAEVLVEEPADEVRSGVVRRGDPVGPGRTTKRRCR